MGPEWPHEQPRVASILKSAALPPRHISAEHWAELTQESAIPPDLAALNFRTFGDGFTDPERERNALLAEAIARLNPQPGHSYQARMRLAWQYGHLDHGGWKFCGDALPGHEPTPRWKPNQPRTSKDGRVVKYEARPRAEQGLLLPQYSERAWRLVAARYDLPMPADLSIGFWQWALQTPELPLHPAEGEKKACCLAGLGFAAIGLPGIWMGRRVPEKDGVKRRDLAVLVPELQALAVEGRTFCIAFDRDAKPSTAEKVDDAAVTLGHLLEASGCNVGIARIPERWWADKTGADDLVADGMADELIAALNDPLCLSEMAWHHRQRQERKKPVAIQLASRKLADEAELRRRLEAPLVAIRSSKGSGKTLLLEGWLADQPKVVAITHRRSLGASLANRLKLQWRNDLDRAAGQCFNEATGEAWTGLPPRLALCADSLLALGDPEQYSDALVVIDEASQVLNHLLTSTTKNCQELRGLLLQQLRDLLRHCKQVVLLDADLSDAEMAWVEEAKGCKAVLIDNSARPAPWQVTFWEHSGSEALQQALVNAVKAGEKPVVVTDSREMATAIDELLKATTGASGALITSRTVDTPEVQALLPRLNDQNAVSELHWLAASPSISSGVSIEHEAFSAVYGLFGGGSLDDAEILQALARVRPCVPRHVWVKPHTRASHPVSTAWWPEQVERDLRERRKDQAAVMRRQLAPDLLSGTPLEVAEAFDGVIKLWATFTARRNYSHAHLRAFVLARLRHEGHSIHRYEAPLEEQQAKALRQLKSELKEERTNQAAIATATARTISKTEAADLQRKGFRTPAEQAALQKLAISQRLALDPQKLTPELVTWGDQWSSAAKRLAMVLHPEMALAADHQQLTATEPLMPWDQGLRAERSAWAEAIGLPAFVRKFCGPDSPGWNSATPEVQELAKLARQKWRDGTSRAFGISIKLWPRNKNGWLDDDAARAVEKDLDGYAMKLVGKLLRHIGILTVAKRTNSEAREYRPDSEHLTILMEAVDRLRQKASGPLHNPTFSLKEQTLVESRSEHLPKPLRRSATGRSGLAYATPALDHHALASPASSPEPLVEGAPLDPESGG